jgi:hypothetical protein
LAPSTLSAKTGSDSGELLASLIFVDLREHGRVSLNMQVRLRASASVGVMVSIAYSGTRIIWPIPAICSAVRSTPFSQQSKGDQPEDGAEDVKTQDGQRLYRTGFVSVAMR